LILSVFIGVHLRLKILKSSGLGVSPVLRPMSWHGTCAQSSTAAETAAFQNSRDGCSPLAMRMPTKGGETDHPSLPGEAGGGFAD
jgi:hypothetical protein